MPLQISRRLFTVDDCYRMLEAGILRHDERVELIRGELLKMSPIGPRHAAAVDSATRAFVRLAGDDAIIRVQGTTVLDQLTAPEPDLLVLKPRDDFYRDQHPGAADILLLVEVSDSSLEYDSTVKSELYAILGIQEYWIIDLRNDKLLALSDPAGDNYRKTREFHRGDVLEPLLLAGRRLKAELLLA